MNLSVWKLNRDQYNILLESSEFDCEFRELFLQLRYENDTTPIHRLFEKLISDIKSLLERGFLNIVRVRYEELKPKHYKTIIQENLNMDEALKVLEKPNLWLFGSLEALDPLVLSTTDDGEKLLDKIFEVLEAELKKDQ